MNSLARYLRRFGNYSFRKTLQRKLQAKNHRNLIKIYPIKVKKCIQADR
jgi:hypothetical protein